MTEHPPSRPWDEFLKERMPDPAFAEAFHEMEPEFQAAREVIRRRLDQGLTQQEPAERIGTQQASISLLERAAYKPNVTFL